MYNDEIFHQYYPLNVMIKKLNKKQREYKIKNLINEYKEKGKETEEIIEILKEIGFEDEEIKKGN